MKKRLIISIFVMVTMLIGMVAVPNTSAQATDVRIGILAPLTGALGSLGPTFENGATLAIQDLNDMQTDYNFILEVGDTETSATGSQAAASALITAGVVGIIGAAASSATLAAITEAQEAEVPMISYASTSPAITDEEDNGYLFRVVLSDALQGRAAGALAEFLEVTEVGIVGIDDPYGQGLMGSFRTAFEDAGGNVLLQQGYDQETVTDFSSIITTVLDENPEAIFMVSFIDDGAAIINELHDQGFGGYILGTDGISSPTLLAKEGTNTSAEFVMGTAPTLTGTPEFVSAFNAEFATDPTIFVAEAYDATMIMGQAVIEAGGPSSGSAIRDAISTVGDDYAGASGSITFDENGDRTEGKYDIWQFVPEGDGDGLVLETIGSWEAGTLSGADGLVTTHFDVGGLPFNFTAFIFGLMAFAAIAILRKKYN